MQSRKPKLNWDNNRFRRGKTNRWVRIAEEFEGRNSQIITNPIYPEDFGKFGMADSHPVNTPMDPNVKLIKLPDMENYDIPDYRSAIGSLMYVAIGTRPDISFAVQHLSQFMSNPGPAHWTAVKRVFRYLNGTRSLGITFHKGREIEPLTYSDADWGSDQNDRKSISGYVFIMSAGPISWQSKKQPTIALSSMEAEYMAKSLATRQINGYDLSLPNSAFLTPELLLSMLTTKAPSITQSTQLITATLNTLTYSIISSMRSSFLTKSKLSTAQPKIIWPIYLQKHYQNQGTKI